MLKKIVICCAFFISTTASAQSYSDKEKENAQALLSDIEHTYSYMQEKHIDEMANLFACTRVNAQRLNVVGDITAAGTLNKLCAEQRHSYVSACQASSTLKTDRILKMCDGAAGLVMASGLLPDQEK
ncbi:hypothetical protein K2X14_07820 [Acetobacter sp. TBRC 12305]|uniref:Uncharacterized protein n=1 Tax=Acetobacter garciniae TaxID=2817435 RepID=A0A939HIY3_9PROT|nr:hypothetical protein [Acetobacter garciniae]MBO1325288.1 hypothetical protein [Acetobacter garciniae]MBX0344740.1 hypothetical protein [Acetobacter garciniae]